MRHSLFVVLLLISGLAYGQDTLYVNMDNLILRDLPEKEYEVLAILYAPCPLITIHSGNTYEGDMAVNAKFYEVSARYYDDDGRHHNIMGWVEKRYVVRNLSAVTAPTVNKNELPKVRDLLEDVPSYTGCDFNAGEYPPPKYKGGEIYTPPKRVYRTGPRGGCYYVGPNGHKNYVDPKHCK